MEEDEVKQLVDETKALFDESLDDAQADMKKLVEQRSKDLERDIDTLRADSEFAEKELRDDLSKTEAILEETNEEVRALRKRVLDVEEDLEELKDALEEILKDARPRKKPRHVE